MVKLKASSLVETLVAMTIVLLMLGLTFSFCFSLVEKGYQERHIHAHEKINEIMRQCVMGIPIAQIDVSDDSLIIEIKQDEIQGSPELVQTTVLAISGENTIASIHEIHPSK